MFNVIFGVHGFLVYTMYKPGHYFDGSFFYDSSIHVIMSFFFFCFVCFMYDINLIMFISFLDTLNGFYLCVFFFFFAFTKPGELIWASCRRYRFPIGLNRLRLQYNVLFFVSCWSCDEKLYWIPLSVTMVALILIFRSRLICWFNTSTVSPFVTI